MVSAGPRINLVESVTIPAQYNGVSVTELSGSAFAGCTSLKEINLPDTLLRIPADTAFAGCTVEEAERAFAGKGYGEFKLAVGETVADVLAPIQAEQKRLLSDKAYLNAVLKEGAERAFRAARRTLSKVYRKIGFYQGD